MLTIHCKVHHVTLDGESRCFCGGEDYVERTDTLEQHYQQLKRLTRHLWLDYRKAFVNLCGLEGRMKIQREFTTAGKWRKMLEQLGVIVDD